MDELKALPQHITQHLADHVALYLADPEKAHLWDASVIGLSGTIKTLLLRTKGRKSGEIRHVTLQYFALDGVYVVVGSRGGTAEHPAWFLNLVAEPACEIQVGGPHAHARARVAAGPERVRLWQQVSSEQPVYQRYQARTKREIPVIVLEPVPDMAGSQPPQQQPRTAPVTLGGANAQNIVRHWPKVMAHLARQLLRRAKSGSLASLRAASGGPGDTFAGWPRGIIFEGTTA